MIDDHIPIVELDDELDTYLEHESGSSRSADTIQSIGDSLARWGFVSIVQHGVKRALLDQAYDYARKVFALTTSQKLKYEDKVGGRQRGYTPFLMERAKGQVSGDLKEFWHIGRELEVTHPYLSSGMMRTNLFPHEVPGFQHVMLNLYEELDRLAHRMLRVIEHYLQIPSGQLSRLAYEGNSVLRVVNYPDLKEIERVPGSVRAAAHEDINLLTLLPAATQPGLQLLTREGEWIDVNSPPGSIILDTGDMMNAVTGGRMPSTTHRVVNPDEESAGGRLSMPFFMHPRPDAVLEVLVGSKDVQSIEGIGMTAQAYLDRRLSENGLMTPPQT